MLMLIKVPLRVTREKKKKKETSFFLCVHLTLSFEIPTKRYVESLCSMFGQAFLRGDSSVPTLNTKDHKFCTSVNFLNHRLFSLQVTLQLTLLVTIIDSV